MGIESGAGQAAVEAALEDFRAKAQVMQAEFLQAVDNAQAKAAAAVSEVQKKAQEFQASLAGVIGTGAIVDDVSASLAAFQDSVQQGLTNASVMFQEAQQDLNDLKQSVQQAIENGSASLSGAFELESNLVTISANFANGEGLDVFVDWNSEEVSREDAFHHISGPTTPVPSTTFSSTSAPTTSESTSSTSATTTAESTSSTSTAASTTQAP